ncbi:Serine/threonine-protein kinase haspin [Merluccius polli]|uniref:Serine/threonine-protein kinase haspin n=1 Tax=Merluccius polli TaxID=89951 RepID=A0AA47N4P1_MERPO|nr:Serine/threonine-protein kinase haspin [Merluccius polli]
MDRGKPVFIKTYGKSRRQVAPDNRSRKQAFASTSSSSSSSSSVSESDSSVFEPSVPKKIRKESSAGAGRKGVRPVTRRAVVCLKEKEHIYDLSTAADSPVVQKKRRARGTTCRPVLDSSESEGGSTSAPKSRRVNMQQKKKLSVCFPSAGRFVTRRRATNLRPVRSQASRSVLNSSEDFAAGRESSGPRRILRPSRRRVPSALQFSAVDISEPDAGTRSSVTDLHQPEVSLVEAAERSLGPCPRKPLFCSTPSASLHKRPHPKTSPATLPSAAFPHGTLSHLSIFSTSQEDIDSSGYRFCAPNPAQLRKQSTAGESQMEPSLILIGEYRDSLASKPQCRELEGRSSEQTKSQDGDTGLPNGLDVPTPAASPTVSSDPLRTRLAWEETNDGSHFVSASAGLEWLVGALKHICLTKHCTVPLERLEKQFPGLLHSQSTYSMCLDQSSSGYPQQTTSLMESVEDPHLEDPPQSEENGETLDPSQSLLAGSITCEDLPSAGQSFLPDMSARADQTADGESAVTDSQIANGSQFTDDFQSFDQTTRQEDSNHLSVVSVDSSNHIDGDDDDDDDNDDKDNVDEDDDNKDDGGEGGSGTQSLEDSPPTDDTVFTDTSDEEWLAEIRAKVKEECLLRKCNVPVQRVALSQPPATAQLKPEESSSARSGYETVGHKAKPSERNTATKTDLVKHKHSRTSTARSTTAVPSLPSPDPDGRAQEPAVMLKELCFPTTCCVLVERLTPDLGQSLGSGLHPESHEPTDADRHDRPRRFSKRRSCLKDNLKPPVALDDRAIDPLDNPAKRKKLSVAPREKKRRERSMSKDRSGTARKACISGLSVSRWKDRSNTSALLFQSNAGTRGASKAGDCSITELVTMQQKPSKVLTESLLQCSGELFSTPARAGRLNLSSMLADLTPNTHTWSRLKAALSVHRKTRGSVGQGEAVNQSSPHALHNNFLTPLHVANPFSPWSTLQSACEGDEDLSDGDKVYAECGQQGPLSWEECILPHRLKRCMKIGEGTFGEVFSTTNALEETVALKIIPVEGSGKVNGEEQKTFGEILHEIIISKELSSLKNKTHNQTHGFIGLNDLHCVQGCYPTVMLDAWDAFDQQKGSENDRPDFFDKQQLFLILEFEFGGSDLENSNGTLSSLVVAKSILHQVTAALAVAEQELCFEHRDLHWGNVLVKTTKVKKGTFVLNGKKHSLDTKGVLVRIIDYSLSRLEIDGLTVSCDIAADEELFMGQGDYQFDIYRLMREANGNEWSDYRPHSNVLWLHYLSSKLRAMKYRGTGGKAVKDAQKELARFHDNLLQYCSATEALQNCPLFQ